MHLLTCDCILVDRINLITIYNLLTGTAQLNAIKRAGLQSTKLYLVVLLVVSGIDVCYISSGSRTVVVCIVRLVIFTKLELLVEIEHIFTKHIISIAIHSGTLHSLALIYKGKHLTNLHIGCKGRFSVARYKTLVGPTNLYILVTGINIAEYLYIVERVAHLGNTNLTSLHLYCRRELNKTTEYRTLCTQTAIYPSGVGETTLKQSTQCHIHERHFTLEYPQVNHKSKLALEHSIELSCCIESVLTACTTTVGTFDTLFVLFED